MIKLILKCFKCREEFVFDRKVNQCKLCGHDVVEHVIKSANTQS